MVRSNLDADTHRPRVSIGLPVYNGEQFLGEAIDSILNQSFTDFELILSDNASTDGTAEICRSRVCDDDRVHYHRFRENVGATRNFNRVVELARGDYFKWAAHDDVHDTECVSRCVEVLDGDPSVVLTYPRSQDIDAEGRRLDREFKKIRNDDHDAVTRFADLIRLDYSCESIFGLMRAAVLRRTRLLSNFADSDRVLLAEIGLAGRIFEIPERLFFHRQHANRSVSQFKGRQERSAWFDASKAGRPAFPYTRELVGFLGAVRRSSLSRGHRARCYGLLARWVAGNLGHLWEDVTYAGRYVLRPLKHRIVGPPRGAGGGAGR